MAYLHMHRHPHKSHNREFLILAVILLIVLMSYLLISFVIHLPKGLALPQSVISNSEHSRSKLQLDSSSRLKSSAANSFQADSVIYRPTGSIEMNQPAQMPINSGSRETQPDVSTATPLKSALENLLRGPTAAEIRAGHYSEIPKGTELLGVNKKNNTVTVDLSEEFASGGGSTSMLERVNELRHTVNSVTGHSTDLSIAINGKQMPVLGGEGLEVN